ncbi:hypothetical protein M5689_001549 [Euphorbia peplus]|nr:hypothetical protein M5689_001549 [Euphorbia peplus]
MKLSEIGNDQTRFATLDLFRILAASQFFKLLQFDLSSRISCPIEKFIHSILGLLRLAGLGSFLFPPNDS